MSDKEAQNSVTKVNNVPGGKSTIWDDFLEIIKEIPLGIGPSLVFLARRLGTKRFVLVIFTALFFFAGVIGGWAFVYFGWAPNFVVSEKYRWNTRKAEASQRSTPTSIGVVPINDPKPEWLRPYIIWMEDEADAQKAVDATLHVGVGAVSHVLQSPTTEFSWSLKAGPGFDVDGRAFRMTTEGFIQPLKHRKDGNSIYFEVPECEKREELYAVVIAKWKGEMPPVDIESTFNSIIKQGR